jgi:excisionase family DNA binding protein
LNGFYEKEVDLEKLLFKPQEAGDALGVSRSKAYELIASGAIPSVRIGGSVRVPVEGLRQWIAERTTDAEAAKGR